MCDRGFIWNPNNCECECDDACDVGKYLDHENCKCRKEIVDNENENRYKWSSCTLYIVLMIVVFTICVRIGTYFVYYNWSLVKNVSCIEFNARIQTAI